MQYVIISDLHIGGDNSLAIFHAQEQLGNFLRSLGNEPIALVINGDSFDFLAVEPWEFSRTAAKLDAAIFWKMDIRKPSARP